MVDSVDRFLRIPSPIRRWDERVVDVGGNDRNLNAIKQMAGVACDEVYAIGEGLKEYAAVWAESCKSLILRLSRCRSGMSDRSGLNHSTFT